MGMMANWAIWVLLAGGLIVAELFTGTFYLLMLAMGLTAGGIAAYAGLALEWQLLIAAVIGIAATVLLRRSRLGRVRRGPATRDPNVSMDIGQLIEIGAWRGVNDAYSARAPYRGALWDVDLEAGEEPVAGQFIIREIRGSRLIVAAVKNKRADR
ncbi:MAG: transrane protein [Herbaspirillum sp.]|jgi:membrane protein implicated in regulation of membrane protease activity|nr:transrane protein [Herbaspirillum sp.]